MRDTGQEEAKESIQNKLDSFLDDDDSSQKPEAKKMPLMTDAGPVTPFVPTGPATPAEPLQN
jgi:hypothetical protein